MAGDHAALVGDSAALIERTRLLLEDARTRLVPTVDRPARRPRPPTVPLRLALSVPAAVGLFLLGVAVSEISHGPTDRALSVASPAPPAVAMAPSTTTAPVSTAPSPPLWVTIPRLGSKAYVDAEVRVIPDGPEKGLLEAPPNYHDLGWFRQIDGGLLVLDGHVGYHSDPGPLAFIGSLKPGDQVILGNQSSQQSFRVQVTGHTLKGQLPAQYFSSSYDSDVMLITCDFQSPFSNGHFADNVYVVAEPGK